MEGITFGPLSAAGFSFVGMLIGLLIGNRLALSRDHSRDWNDLVRPVTDMLLDVIWKKSLGEDLDIVVAWKIRERLRWIWHRRGYDTSVYEYKRSRGDENMYQYDPSTGGFIGGCGPCKDPGMIVRAAARLLGYLKPR